MSDFLVGTGEFLMGKHLREAPAFTLGNGTGLFDAHPVSNCCFSVLIMSVELLRALDDLLELRMLQM